MRQMGNAVPVQLGEVIGKWLGEQVEAVQKQRRRQENDG
jgi:site-specific DNA-cytosine methylase